MVQKQNACKIIAIVYIVISIFTHAALIAALIVVSALGGSYYFTNNEKVQQTRVLPPNFSSLVSIYDTDSRTNFTALWLGYPSYDFFQLYNVSQTNGTANSFMIWTDQTNSKQYVSNTEYKCSTFVKDPLNVIRPFLFLSLLSSTSVEETINSKSCYASKVQRADGSNFTMWKRDDTSEICQLQDGSVIITFLELNKTVSKLPTIPPQCRFGNSTTRAVTDDAACTLCIGMCITFASTSAGAAQKFATGNIGVHTKVAEYVAERLRQLSDAMAARIVCSKMGAC